MGETDGVASIAWAKASEDGLRRRSSSGAIFGLLAKEVLSDDGGTVYGAAFVDGCRAVAHRRADDECTLDRLMRSKYVQSTMSRAIYEGVSRDLGAGKSVLFSGTACQIAAMRNYLSLRRVPCERLLLVDVICHGVPSPRLWRMWVDWMSHTTGAKIDEINFRSKSSGWLTFSVAYSSASEEVRTSVFSADWYMKAFLGNASLRKSCLDCPAKRCCGSDMTLGDFWGIQNIHPEIEDGLGVSAVTCNSDKGRVVLEGLRGLVAYGDATWDEVMVGNPSLTRSVAPHPRRDEFLHDVAGDMTVEDMMAKWTFEPSIWNRIRRFVRGKLGAVVRRARSVGNRTLRLGSSYRGEN
ncbi:Coenzyme F420 hydrogenase/dehydrogenase, beta subunit C-terminal domain [Olsenella profusa]|nr:Coenzyme F420 hydrogenase/dehydrogenase, beta subunit C-terminal domain [Olsenella profusa]